MNMTIFYTHDNNICGTQELRERARRSFFSFFFEGGGVTWSENSEV